MKIGIIDTDHYFYIYSLIQLFEGGDNKITIYCNQRVYKRCQEDLSERHDITYVVQEKSETWPDFLARNVNHVNAAGYSYFFMCPIYADYKEHYKFVSALKTLNILVVFNLNGWINPPTGGLRQFWNSWYKRKIINKIKWIAIDEHFHNHALKLGCKNHILHIPSLLYDPAFVAKHRHASKQVKIIVPGSVDPDRRDYHVVLDAFSKVLEKRQDFEVVLLGALIAQYGKEIQARANKINEKYGRQIIKTYDKQYNDAEFLRQIVSGHFLIAPVLPKFVLDGITEIYGISKSTGSCFDILAYAIPGVFPSWLSVNSHFNSSTLRYEDAESLSKIVMDFLDHPEKIEAFRANALANSAHYSIDNVKERLMKSLPSPQVLEKVSVTADN